MSRSESDAGWVGEASGAILPETRTPPPPVEAVVAGDGRRAGGCGGVP